MVHTMHIPSQSLFPVHAVRVFHDAEKFSLNFFFHWAKKNGIDSFINSYEIDRSPNMSLNPIVFLLG